MNNTIYDLANKIEESKKEVVRKTLNTSEFAELLGVSPNKARQLMKSKGFPAITIGNRKLVVISKLDSWLDENIGQVF
ncbi:MAG: helix-turn-helix domain-containing protein [Cellulosilyticum sp.]|nr:helix-turn-helix domain-containing protein [Cellulosilyticum sp.]